MTQKEKRARMAAIVEELKKVYPVPVCALESGGDPWKLLVMGRLSAQCTDARVNIVCRELFARFPTPQDMAYAKLSEVEQIVRPCGLYHTKAQNIIDASRMLIEDFDGEMPREMDALLLFPGVGRKIAICCAVTSSVCPRSWRTRIASAFADALGCTRKARKTRPVWRLF